MSKLIEGKLSNQFPKHRYNSGNPTVICECCKTVFESPEQTVIRIEGALVQMFSYINSTRFIYESNSGSAVVYCSDYCRRKHNHRFQDIDKTDRRLKNFQNRYDKAVQSRDWETCDYLSDMRVNELLMVKK